MRSRPPIDLTHRSSWPPTERTGPDLGLTLICIAVLGSAAVIAVLAVALVVRLAMTGSL